MEKICLWTLENALLRPQFQVKGSTTERYCFQEKDDLKDLMMKVFREGLEGLVMKDVNVRSILFLCVWGGETDVLCSVPLCVLMDFLQIREKLVRFCFFRGQVVSFLARVNDPDLVLNGVALWLLGFVSTVNCASDGPQI